ncbi:unnamed protein product [Linum trigynum]|uniref:Uncharacterized protein n=1 Tax=Linum trigynum TaxID=586398 RepID=A0AAV2GBI2_9ROSI
MSGSDGDGGEIRRFGGRSGDDKAIDDADDGPRKSDNEKQQVQEEMTRSSKKKKRVNKRHDFNRNGETRSRRWSGIGIGCCFPRNPVKAKPVAVVAKIKPREETEPRRPSSSSSAGKCIGFRHCCYGFNKPPPTLKSQQQPVSSSSLSTTAIDPNAPNFTSEMLRILIQRNDFYCRECNPHFTLSV